MQKETVIVTHGFGGHWLVMVPLCRRLRKLGYNVINWGYRSLWKDSERHAEALRLVFEQVEADDSIERYHFAGHSYGNILLRLMLQSFDPQKLGSIVMITPPNKGSHVASKFAPILGRISTTLCEIQDTEDSLVNSIETQIDPDFEIGIIQANFDLVVAQHCTRLAEAKEYIMLPGFHSSVLFKEPCAVEVNHFLQNGSFSPMADEEAS